MRTKIAIVLLIILANITVYLYDYFSTPQLMEEQKKEANFNKLPEIELTLFNGNKISPHTMKQPTILLNFWASWCTTCVEEMPDMIKLAQKMNGKLGLIFLSIDENEAIAKKFKQKLANQGINVNAKNIYWARDKNKDISLNKFNVIKVPETIIINKNKEMTSKIVGKYDWSYQNISAMLK